MKRFLLAVIFLINCTTSFSQIVFEQESMGGAGSASSSFLSSNPGSYIDSLPPSLSAQYYKHPYIKELDLRSINLVVPIAQLLVKTQLSQTGYFYLKETKSVTALALRVKPNMSLGVGLEYRGLATPGQQYHTFTPQLGLCVKNAPFQFAFKLTHKPLTPEYSSLLAATGVAYAISNSTIYFDIVINNLHSSPTSSIGFETNFTSHFKLFNGYNFSNSSFHSSITIHSKAISLGFSGMYQHYIGIQLGIQIAYSF